MLNPRKDILSVVLIIMLGIFCYANTFASPFVFDDEIYVVENPLIKDLRYILDPTAVRKYRTASLFYYESFKNRFAGHATFALNFAVHGLNVAGYHAVNLFIHIINAVLVYWLVLLTFMTPQTATEGPPSSGGDRSHRRPLALVAALLFVSHPLQTQAVTYISQRFTSLATMFYLLTLVLYIKWRLKTQNTEDRQQTTDDRRQTTDKRVGIFRLKSGIWYLMSVLSAVLAMKTKEIAFTLPAVVALYEFMFFSGPIGKRTFILLPIALTAAIIPLSYLGSDEPIGKLMSDMGGAMGPRSVPPAGVYLATQVRVVATYLRLLFLPVGQNLDHDYPLYRSFFDPAVILSFLLLLLIAGTAFRLVFLRRSPLIRRLVPFGVFWFFITLSVESSVIPIYDVIFEHRVYLPSIGAIIAITAFAYRLAGTVGSRHPGLVDWLPLVFALVIISFSLAAYGRNRVWQDERALWNDVIEKSPRKARGYNNLGNAYYKMGQDGRAMALFSRAIKIDPSYYEAFYNMGVAVGNKGDHGKAAECFTDTLTASPGFAKAYTKRGIAYVNMADRARALTDFQKACGMGDEEGCGALQSLKTERQFGIDKKSRNVQ